MLLGLFCRDECKYIKRILLGNEINLEVENLFISQHKDFFYDEFNELPKNPFNPSWEKSADEVLYIDDYDDTDDIFEALDEPASIEVCDPETDLHFLRAVFMKHDDEVLIQLIDSRRVLLPKSQLTKPFWILNLGDSASSNTFVKTVCHGLHFDSKLTAVLRGKRLFFKSFYQANRIFDLSDYLQEATVDTAKDFLSLPNIVFEGNIEDVASMFSKPQLRKIPKILALGFLNRYTAEEIARRANKTKQRVNIELVDGKIKIPEDSDDRAKLLKFLGNGIVSSYLDDDRDYEAGDTRPIGQ